MIPRRQVAVGAMGVFVVALFASTAVALAIPKDQLDAKKVYYGQATAFEKPAEIRYDDIVKATPEYKEIKEKKIERGTGKYWLLMSQASDRAVKAIATVGKDSEYDLIAASGYLGKLEPAITATDITELVLEAIKG
ncbi:MAG: hypothetical protein AMXMBFR84_06070 [Candidatus Hydrogenedentota bacterium]